MPNRITVEFFNQTIQEYWSNRYFTTAPVNDAGTTLDALVAAHRPALRADSIITKIRIDDNVANTDNFDTVSINLAGTAAAGGQNLMPFFVVARVDFDVAGGGRPSRKYLRGLADEGSFALSGIDAGMVTILNTFGDAVVAIGTICDPQGNAFVDAVPWPFPAMRQLRRGSKKKVIPS